MSEEAAQKFDIMREDLKAGMKETLEGAKPEVPEDYGAQNGFFAKINGWVQSTEQYEDELTKAIAISVIPENIVAMQSTPVDQLKALLAWFKQDFFKWTDKPTCKNCNETDPEKMTAHGVVGPTPEEVQCMARRTEVYQCATCGQP